MKFINKFSILLLLLFVSFQSCVEEESIITEVETFKSIDDLPTDDRFVEVILGSINLTTQADSDRMDRAKELMNQESRSSDDQAEISQILGFESWDAFTDYNQKQQELIQALNADYNLAAYDLEELKEYSTQVYDYLAETQAVSRDDLQGPVGGGIGALNLDVLECLIIEGIVYIYGTLLCALHPNPPLCQLLNTIDSIIHGILCLI
jgi:hypothetical protein